MAEIKPDSRHAILNRLHHRSTRGQPLLSRSLVLTLSHRTSSSLVASIHPRLIRRRHTFNPAHPSFLLGHILSILTHRHTCRRLHTR
jgi:hypothetical protein